MPIEPTPSGVCQKCVACSGMRLKRNVTLGPRLS